MNGKDFRRLAGLPGNQREHRIRRFEAIDHQLAQRIGALGPIAFLRVLIGAIVIVWRNVHVEALQPHVGDVPGPSEHLT